MRQTQISRRGLDRTSVTVLALALAAGSVAAQPGATPTGTPTTPKPPTTALPAEVIAQTAAKYREAMQRLMA